MPQVGRAVRVESAAGHCSGYVIAGRLVLTAAHGTPGPGATVTVRPPASPRAFTATVVWRGRPGDRDDAALVRVVDDGWPQPAGRDPQFGRVVTRQSRIAVRVHGFPQWVQRGDWPAETWELTATTNLGSLYVQDLYALTLDGPAPGPRESWAGLSGAAVFCGELLTAVVFADMAGGQRQYLQAVPVAVLLRDDGFRQVLTVHGVPARAAAVEFAAAQACEPAAHGSPANLLRPRSQVVRFRGRHELMDELRAWCAGGGFRAWLLHGPGGQGKTRVAQELTERQTDQRWAVLWLDENAPDDSVAAIGDAAVPLLVIVDYAEGRSGQLGAVLRACARHDGTHPLRLLLLARTAGDWWDELSTDRAGLLDGAVVHALDVLDPGPAGRAEAYREAVADLAEALPGPLPHPGAGSAAGDGTALSVQMRALADLLDAAHPADRAPGREPPVEERVLSHEKRYWRQTAAEQGLRPGLSDATLHSALAAALLFGAGTIEEADELLSRLPALADQPYDRRDAVRRWIAGLYPSATLTWGSLQPDRLVEWFTGTRLAQDARLLDAVLPAAGDARATRMLTIYARAAEHPAFEGGLDEALTGLCARHSDQLSPLVIDVATTVRRPGPLVAALDQLLDVDVDDFEWFTALIDRVRPSSHCLGDWVVEAVEHLAGYWLDVHAFLLGQDTPPPDQLEAVTHELCRLFQAYAVRLRALGRYEDSASAAAVALDFLARGDAASREGQRLTAGVLHNLALDDLGDPAAALPQAETAAGILTALDADDVELALTLNTVAVLRGAVGRTVEALEAAERSAGIHRELVRTDPDAHLHELAMVLSNQSGWLGDLRQYEAAERASSESVAIRRDLAARAPDVYLDGLATSLNNHATCLAAVDRHDEALDAARESVDLRRGLAAQRPAAHLAALALALNNLGVRLGDAGRLDEALDAAEESVRIYRPLHTDRPDTHGPGLARALANTARHLRSHGRDRDALEQASEAVALFERLPAETCADRLADTLLLKHKTLRTLGEVGDPVDEAVVLYRGLARARPAEFRATLIDALRSAAHRHADLGEHDRALAFSAEAVGVARAATPELRENLVVALMTHAGFLGGAGRDRDALDAAGEALSLGHEPGDAEPAPLTGLDELAGLLADVAAGLRDIGESERAEQASAESLAVGRCLAGRDPGQFLLPLARALVARANYLGEAGYPHAALDAVTEAIGMARRTGDDESGDEPDLLGRCLHTRFAALDRLGRPQEALEAITEAVPRIRRQAAAHPHFTADLAGALYAQAIGHHETGDDQAAVRSATESSALYERLSHTADAERVQQLVAYLAHS